MNKEDLFVIGILIVNMQIMVLGYLKENSLKWLKRPLHNLVCMINLFRKLFFTDITRANFSPTTF